MTLDGRGMRLLYATETGTAAELAQLAAEHFAKYVTTSLKVVEISEYDYTQLPSEDLVLFIVSTTGDGEVPQGILATMFWMFFSLSHTYICFRYEKVLAFPITQRLAYQFTVSSPICRVWFG